MLNTEMKKCNGCSVCAFVCPTKCIKMKENSEHFIEPEVDKKKCINCNLCNKVCTAYNKREEINEKKCYIAQLKNREMLKECASGGAFYGIATKIINNEGIVFGVAYENKKLQYISIDKIEDLNKLTKSKYFQCEITINDYQKIKKTAQEKIVLVSGTPCQISAIKNIPGLNLRNVYFLEILCQGIPNHYVIDSYDKEKEKNKGKEIINHYFRSKDKYVGRNYLNKYEYSDGEVEYFVGEEDYLSLTFQRQMYLRNSCYKCNYTNEERVADFTVGDYWKEPNNEEIILKDGVSVILCNSQKSIKFMENQNEFLMEEIDYKEALKDNIPFHHSVKRPFGRNYSFHLLKLGIKPSIITKILCFKYYIKKFIRRK